MKLIRKAKYQDLTVITQSENVDRRKREFRVGRPPRGRGHGNIRRYGDPQLSGIKIGSWNLNGISNLNVDFKKKY